MFRLKGDPMKRHTFVYLFISLMMVTLVFGTLPLAASDTFNAPVGVTETPTSVAPEDTPIAPEDTPIAPEDTPIAPEDTPIAPEDTPIAREDTPIAREDTPIAREDTPAPTHTPIAPEDTPIAPEDTPAPTHTPAPTVVGVPNTGGAAPQGASFWILAWIALIVGSLGALAFALSIRAHRPRGNR